MAATWRYSDGRAGGFADRPGAGAAGGTGSGYDRGRGPLNGAGAGGPPPIDDSPAKRRREYDYPTGDRDAPLYGGYGRDRPGPGPSGVYDDPRGLPTSAAGPGPAGGLSWRDGDLRSRDMV